MKRSLTLALHLLTFTAVLRAADLPLEKIKLPNGFKIEVYAAHVPGARSLAVSPSGIVYVGTRREGVVYALVDDNGDKKADRVLTLATGLIFPNGVAFRHGSLYVAEISRILRFDQIEANLARPQTPVIVYDKFPTDGWHGWKFIAFGPDGKLYVPVGANCNICEVEEPFGTITRMNPDGSAFEIFAKGVRNTVGFDWHPDDRELWFTDNGGDNLGDDIPPDELNRARVRGMNFGFPYCHGGDYPDPNLGKKRSCKDFVAPARKLGPHVAALGMRFYTGGQFPEAYQNDILIAEHGSWNRTASVGYRITRVHRETMKTPTYEVFAEGWKDASGQVWGRPVDILILADGSILVSDDHAGAVYRISYVKL